MRQSSKDGDGGDKASLRGGRKYSTSTLSSASSSSTSTPSSASAGTSSSGASSKGLPSAAAATALLTPIPNTSTATSSRAAGPHPQLAPSAVVASAVTPARSAHTSALLTLRPHDPAAAAARGGGPVAAPPVVANVAGRNSVPLMLVRQKAIPQQDEPPLAAAAAEASSSPSVPLNLAAPDQASSSSSSATSLLASAQSVKEVLINSCKRPAPTSATSAAAIAAAAKASANMAELQDIASNLEQQAGGRFHPSNPEGSMIKELLIKLKSPEQQQQQQPQPLAAVSSSVQATVIEIKSNSVPSTAAGESSSSSSTRPTHIIYADPGKLSSPSPGHPPVPLVRGNIPPPPHGVDIIRSREATGSPSAKKPRLIETSSSSAGILAGGSVRAVEPGAERLPQSQPGLLQVAQSGLQSGGGVIGGSSNAPSSTSAAAAAPLIPTSAFSIPGIPTPSLSGVLTGIKSTPLFSLPGGRRLPKQGSAAAVTATTGTTNTVSNSSITSSEKPAVPYVLGIPGPYSLASPTTPTQSTSTLTSMSTMAATMSATEASSSSSSAAAPSIPTITVSPATAASSSTSSDPTSEIKVEVPSEGEEGGKFLRPSSLSLAPGSFQKKKHVMVASGGATLVSPETPRPRKSYVLTYQNGTAYTHLGLKCSTRVYYCSIFNQQPMYVQHKPRLSMYSNWKVVTKDSHPSGIKPKESLALYDSVYHDSTHGSFVVAGKKRAALTVAHSSEWKESERRRKQKAAEKEKDKDRQKGDSEAKKDDDKSVEMAEADVSHKYFPCCCCPSAFFPYFFCLVALSAYFIHVSVVVL